MSIQSIEKPIEITVSWYDVNGSESEEVIVMCIVVNESLSEKHWVI